MLYPFMQHVSYQFCENLLISLFTGIARTSAVVPAYTNKQSPRGQPWGVAPTLDRDVALEHTEGNQDALIPPQLEGPTPAQPPTALAMNLDLQVAITQFFTTLGGIL